MSYDNSEADCEKRVDAVMSYWGKSGTRINAQMVGYQDFIYRDLCPSGIPRFYKVGPVRKSDQLLIKSGTLKADQEFMRDRGPNRQAELMVEIAKVLFRSVRARYHEAVGLLWTEKNPQTNTINLVAGIFSVEFDDTEKPTVELLVEVPLLDTDIIDQKVCEAMQIS